MKDVKQAEDAARDQLTEPRGAKRTFEQILKKATEEDLFEDGDEQ